MRVYKIRFGGPVVDQGIVLANEREWRKINFLDGTPQLDWEPIHVTTPEVLVGEPVRWMDFPWAGGGVMVLRQRAYEAIGHLLAPFGEFLPLLLNDGSATVWLYNVLTILDVLDAEGSDIQYTIDGNAIFRVDEHSFQGIPTNVNAFKVPQLKSLFLSDRVVDAIASADLVPPTFELVWQEG